MFDVFYIGKKPNLFAHEKPADSIQHAQTLSRTRYCWIVNYLSDYTRFDFLWEPPPWQSHQRHAWASQWQKDSGTYLVPKHDFVETNYHSTPVIKRLSSHEHWTATDDHIGFDFSWHPDPTEPPMTYQFGTQHQITGGPKYYNGSPNVKYVDQPRCQKTTVDDNWEIPKNIDFENFDWTWHPDDRDPPYIYQFGTQHQRTGGPRYLVSGATDVKYVDQIRVRTNRVATAIIEIDHMDGNAGQIPNTNKTSRYFDNYLDTLKRIAKNIGDEHEFVWICSSICDYADFDFSWHPEQWQATMLHVFPSDGEKFGDTFFMHVPTFQYRADTCQLLEWYDVNFVEDVSVPRRPMPVIQHQFDNQVDAVKSAFWAGPLALFTRHDYSVDTNLAIVPLWREKTKTIMPLDPGGETVIVPRVATPYIKTQLYDYPYIDKTHYYLSNAPLDVVFISNGEHGSEHHWKLLQDNIGRSNTNHLRRIDGVKGRVAAYHAAARASDSDWFFAVFAKLQINDDFDWSWQPDRLQAAKHYIFHAYNPVNHLVYGHQGMIVYNRRLVLENTGQGLDFTLDQMHEVVPICAGTAYYDNDPWTCWRTAFREALKLRHSLPDVENEFRLDVWTKIGEGVNGHWSCRGAQDAVQYYENVKGEFSELKKSYEWDWLASYALILYPELFTQSKT